MNPRKTKRNKKILAQYKPGRFGYKKLADKFKLSWYTIRDIIKRGY